MLLSSWWGLEGDVRMDGVALITLLSPPSPLIIPLLGRTCPAGMCGALCCPSDFTGDLGLGLWGPGLGPPPWEHSVPPCAIPRARASGLQLCISHVVRGSRGGGGSVGLGGRGLFCI